MFRVFFLFKVFSHSFASISSYLATLPLPFHSTRFCVVLVGIVVTLPSSSSSSFSSSRRIARNSGKSLSASSPLPMLLLLVRLIGTVGTARYRTVDGVLRQRDSVGNSQPLLISTKRVRRSYTRGTYIHTYCRWWDT